MEASTERKSKQRAMRLLSSPISPRKASRRWYDMRTFGNASPDERDRAEDLIIHSRKVGVAVSARTTTPVDSEVEARRRRQKRKAAPSELSAQNSHGSMRSEKLSLALSGENSDDEDATDSNSVASSKMAHSAHGSTSEMSMARNRRQPWSCATCTFVNASNVFSCSVCSAKRPTTRFVATVPSTVLMEQSFALKQHAARSQPAIPRRSVAAGSSNIHDAARHLQTVVPPNAVASRHHPSEITKRAGIKVYGHQHNTRFKLSKPISSDKTGDADKLSAASGKADSDDELSSDEDADETDDDADENNATNRKSRSTRNRRTAVSSRSTDKESESLENSLASSRAESPKRWLPKRNAFRKDDNVVLEWDAIDKTNKLKFDVCNPKTNRTYAIYEFVQPEWRPNYKDA